MNCLNCGAPFEPRKGFVQKFCPGGRCRSEYHNKLKLDLLRQYKASALKDGHVVHFGPLDEYKVEQHAAAHCQCDFEAAVVELVRQSLNKAEVEHEQGKILEQVREWQPE